MARKDWYPEGCATDSVPNYGNPYEVPCGSEGSGSLGQLDTEITAPENSYAPTRKFIKLNWDGQDGFLVPLRAVPVSSISRSARRDLVLQLRDELGRIRVLQQRVESQRTAGVTLSSSNKSVLRCSNNRQNEPPAEDAKKSSLLTSGQGAKLVPAGNKGRAHGSLGKFECGKRPLAPSTMNTVLMKQCETLLDLLMAHQFGWVFANPVDVVKLNLPDYLTIIKHPMDLGSIKKKLTSGLYSSPLDFLADVRLTFSNAMAYNPRGHDVHIMAQTLSKYFEVRWKAIEKKIPASNDKVLRPKSDVCREMETSKLMAPYIKRKIISEAEQDYIPSNVKRTMTDQEKHDLGRELEALLGEMPIHIVDFLREHSSSGRETGEDEIEIDIDDLSDDTLFTLRKLLDDYLQDKPKNCRKAEPCEIEMPNKSGLSTSSLQLCKENPVDEDVDICGSEPPVSRYPTVEMAKDTDYRTSKCISLDGPGGDSDSSTSSSGKSEMGGVKALASANVSMKKLVTGSDIDKKAIIDNTLSGNQSVSCLDQTELTSPQNPRSVDSKFHQEGQNGLPERQVSPSKLHRAALLKNRFADTILKAQEKTLKQGEKGDFERVRREREELEMQRKKEKARLQAEAKVAEDAQRKAEAEAAAAAAAEARRMRELEREAAREALRKMEKTVEISENARFIEDLERLSAAPGNHFLSSVDETSPDHSLQALGSFNFGGINPLEKLGLYMKMDEEEEEGEPPGSSNMLEDVEEGEID